MKYSPLLIILHWVTLLLILFMVFTGLAFRFEWGDAGAIRGHQTIGQLLIVVLALRILAKLRQRTPYQNPHPFWERIAARTTHGALYLCMIAFVVTGYIAASGLDRPVLVWPAGKAFARSDTGEMILEWHYALKWVLLALVTLHVLGALKHLFWDKDDTFSHMTLRSRKDETQCTK
ncbi:cytochrome b [Yoonia tamlensis]|nr:cytochrome b/b6 domain-containing protein [Yoonia tamlensis]